MAYRYRKDKFTVAVPPRLGNVPHHDRVLFCFANPIATKSDLCHSPFLRISGMHNTCVQVFRKRYKYIIYIYYEVGFSAKMYGYFGYVHQFFRLHEKNYCNALNYV